MDLDQLPPHLRERTRILRNQSDDKAGHFVIYWMRTAVRAHENPALDVAKLEADRLNLPLLVYHAISQDYRFASDRHHMFMLQGARDVQAEFALQGISYAFHAATIDDSRPHLVQLANDAAVVVTEDMPVDPPRRYLKALTNRTETTGIVCVDTACVVPMRLVKKAHTRAFKFRSATKRLYEERLTRDWPKQTVKVKAWPADRLPFEPIDLQNADLAELVSRCEIDHAVAPVPDTVGGSTAGYHRWQQFKSKGLNRYARQRNNALIDGVSRMSAYLHYGMVSPMKIAREAANIDNAGAEKYLDELLIWRELAYAFCFFREDHDQLSAIPDWARETLEAHVNDRRPEIYSWEQLARSETDDELWNAAQQSLIVQGELHNNVRMTWGKALLNWTRTPEEALELMIDLNHRYALDGRDPASYGGLLWCLGQFDRPFEPANNIIGTVRPRPTDDHARRLDVDAYRQKVSAARYEAVPDVAIIGAGISGLFAARTLVDHGIPVTVFDKGRGVGGRMSTRRVDGSPTFDHGAQYFTARDQRFIRYVDSWKRQGIVAAWPDAKKQQKIVELFNGVVTSKSDSNSGVRYVGVPSMNAICKHLARDLEVRTGIRVSAVEPEAHSNLLLGEDGNELGRFDQVVVSAPPEQSAELLCAFPQLSDEISAFEMNPCWALMVSFRQVLTHDWVGAFVKDSILSWVARNSTKPQRPDFDENLVLHANPQWTLENWEADPDDVARAMLDAFWQCLGIDLQEPVEVKAHRWKYAIPVNPDPQKRCLFDTEAGVAVCGDWLGGPRVEGAFLSGMSAAGRILTRLVECKPKHLLFR